MDGYKRANVNALRLNTLSDYAKNVGVVKGAIQTLETRLNELANGAKNTLSNLCREDGHPIVLNFQSTMGTYDYGHERMFWYCPFCGTTGEGYRGKHGAIDKLDQSLHIDATILQFAAGARPDTGKAEAKLYKKYIAEHPDTLSWVSDVILESMYFEGWHEVEDGEYYRHIADVIVERISAVKVDLAKEERKLYAPQVVPFGWLADAVENNWMNRYQRYYVAG